MKNSYTLKSVQFILLFFIPFFSFAQLSFTNSNDLIKDTDWHSGAPIGVVDVNGDGYDDIVRINQEGQNKLGVLYQVPGAGYLYAVDVPYFFPASPWCVVVGDVTNDGFCDIMAGGAYGGIDYLTAMDGLSGQFANETLTAPGTFVQGSNFADINNDGWLDLFVCHDDGPSRIFVNDGTGNLVYSDTNLINLNLYPGIEPNSGNYGSVWSDFDSDGDLDLYIAKCRQGVNDPADTRRINQLWVNDGANNYTEMAGSFDLAIGAQSWTADFADIDNDGDFDCFITNHDVQSQLLENTGSGFVDITDDAGVAVFGLAIQGVMKDFNNDGYNDILVTGSTGQLFLNNGDKTFTEVDALTGEEHSFGIGDLNHDGFYDVYAGYGSGFNGASSEDDVLWLNDGNDNNFIALNLIGVQSNRNAVGARVEVYGPWGVQIREVRAGESYGIVNSTAQIIGLGTETTYDSILVRWPSGIVEEFNDLAINQYHTLIENQCQAIETEITPSGAIALCSGESVSLEAPAGYDYLWSNGAEEQSLTVDNSGLFNVTISDANDCIGISPLVEIEFDPDQTPSIEIDGPAVFCSGEETTITSTEAMSYLWSNGDTTQSITISEPGEYFVTAEGDCDFFESNIISVSVFEPQIETEGDTISGPGVANLFATGDSVIWYDVPSGGMPIGFGNEFETPLIDETTDYYAENFSRPDPAYVGMEEHEGTSLFNGDNFNGTLFFNANSTFILRSVKCFTDTPGTREIQLQDADGNVLQSYTFEVDDVDTDTLAFVNFLVEPGEGYRLRTNSSVNQSSLGTTSPRFYRSNDGVEYPYNVEGIVSIYNSDAGSEYFYYFYDWEVQLDVNCVSDRVPVTATILPVIPGTASATILEKQVSAIPNPTTGEVFIRLPQNVLHQSMTVRVMDVNGKQISINGATKLSAPFEFDLSNLSNGMYFIQLADDKGNRYFTKVVKH